MKPKHCPFPRPAPSSLTQPCSWKPPKSIAAHPGPKNNALNPLKLPLEEPAHGYHHPGPARILAIANQLRQTPSSTPRAPQLRMRIHCCLCSLCPPACSISTESHKQRCFPPPPFFFGFMFLHH